MKLSQSDECSPPRGCCRRCPQLRIPLTKNPPWGFNMKHGAVEVTVTDTTWKASPATAHGWGIQYTSKKMHVDIRRKKRQALNSSVNLSKGICNFRIPSKAMRHERDRRHPFTKATLNGGRRSPQIHWQSESLIDLFLVLKDLQTCSWTNHTSTYMPCFKFGWDSVLMYTWKRCIRLGQESSVMLDNCQFLHTGQHLRIRLEPAGAKHWMLEWKKIWPVNQKAINKITSGKIFAERYFLRQMTRTSESSQRDWEENQGKSLTGGRSQPWSSTATPSSTEAQESNWLHKLSWCWKRLEVYHMMNQKIILP